MFAMIRNEIPLNENGQPSILAGRSWFRFFASLYNAVTGGIADDVQALTGTSPYLFQAPQKGMVLMAGGMVSAIDFTRDGVTYYSLGQVAGALPLCKGDTVRVTYSVAPSLHFVPL